MKKSGPRAHQQSPVKGRGSQRLAHWYCADRPTKNKPTRPGFVVRLTLLVAIGLAVCGFLTPYEAAAAAPAHAAAIPHSTAYQEYIQQADGAMTTMMESMAVPAAGDVDRDFVAMMVPHHQGAIDMALAVLRFGKNEQIRRLAQEIIVTQQQEITAMRQALDTSSPTPRVAAPEILECSDSSVPAAESGHKPTP